MALKKGQGILRRKTGIDETDPISDYVAKTYQTLNFAYDIMGRLTGITYPDSSTRSFTYDSREVALFDRPLQRLVAFARPVRPLRLLAQLQECPIEELVVERRHLAAPAPGHGIADHHLVVAKQSDAKGPASTVTGVLGEHRVAEIARMLGGERLSGTTLAHAKEMLSGAS